MLPYGDETRRLGSTSILVGQFRGWFPLVSSAIWSLRRGSTYTYTYIYTYIPGPWADKANFVKCASGTGRVEREGGGGHTTVRLVAELY